MEDNILAKPNQYRNYGIDEYIHYGDVIMGAIVSQITSLTIVYSAVYSGADQIKHQRSASLAFVRGIHRRPMNSPHKWPVTRKTFPFDDVIMLQLCHNNERDDASNRRRLDRLLKCLFRRRSNKTSKLRLTGVCEGNSSVTGEFPAQRASNVENVSIWWFYHEVP